MLETPEVIINPGSIQAEIECNKDLEITLQKREFSIVGDNVYVTTSSEAPQWLLDLINGTIANAIAEGTTDFDDLRENILNAIAAMDIAKNDYDSYVIKLEDAEGRLLAYTETLNATVADSVAQIVSTLVTKVTADEALTIAVDAIQSSINGGAIKAQIDTINTTLATESLSRATQVDTIMAAITDENSGLAANATAVETLYTYVGIDGDLTPTGTGLLSTIEIIQKQNDGVIDTYAGTHYIKVCDANLDDGDLNQLLTNQYPYALWTPMEGSGVPTATTRVVYRDAVSSNEPIVTYTIYKDTATNLKYIYDANTSSWSAITDTEYNNYYETLRAAHVGDVYILYSIEEGVKVYNEACKFVKTAVDTTSPYNTDAEGYGWLRITDTDAQAAYMQALNAYDLADNKRRVFVSTPVLPYDEGDLWVDSSGTYKVVKIYKNGSWVVADEQTAQFANEVYTPTVTTLKNQVDGKIEYYFYNNYTEVSGAISESTALNIIDNAWSTTALKEAANGNVVYFKDTDNGYWYSSTTSNWEALEDTSMLSALRKAEQAKSSADAKVTAYSVKFELQATATTPLGSYVEGNYIIIYRSSATNDTGSVYQKLFYKNSTSIVEHTSNLKVGDIAVGSRAYIKPGTSTAVATEVVYKWTGTAWAELDGRITAISEWGIALENFLETGTTTGTTIDSSSNVYSTLRSEADSDRLNTESKFGYNSNLIVNGKAYTTGFGLVSTGTQTGNWTDPVNGINYPTFNSEFWIKADKFKLTAANGLVSNYVPFEVDGTTGDIKFKGKVTFSSISDASTNIPTISSVTTAQSTANTASTNASAALTKLTDLASDNILSAVEKPTAIKEYNIIIAEQTGIDSQATAYSITTEKTAYDTAVSNLTTYLNGLTVPTAWNSTTGDTTIVGTTFRSKFEDVYTTKQTLLNAITAKAKTLADTAQSSANTAVANAATAQSTADTASSNATSALNQLTDIANDNKLTSSEKSSVRLDWNSIISSYDSNITTATSYGVTTEKTTYTNALVALGTYLNNGTAWSVSSPAVNSSMPSWIADANLNVTTVINGVTFRSNFANLYSSEQILLNKISSTAKNLADAAQSSANSANTAASAAQTTANSKITTFYQPNVPTSSTAGDIWIDTDDGNKMYIANAANVNSIVTSGNGWYNKTLVVPAPDFTSNNDAFAQAQGFVNYADMQNKYSELGSTIINGGFIETDLINVEALSAKNIIAENIKSTSIIAGNLITGSTIRGAYIEGAILKASYLDLNGDIEVLTDYVITPSMYNANPSLYTDAIYIPTINEYRLPTLSTVQANATTSTPVNDSGYWCYQDMADNARGYTLNLPIYAYNVSNVSSNNKFRKIRPFLTINSTTLYTSGYYVRCTNSSSTDSYYSAVYDVSYYLGNTLWFRVHGSSTSPQITTGSGQTIVAAAPSSGGGSATATVNAYGVTLTLKMSYSCPWGFCGGSTTVTMGNYNNFQFSTDIISGNIRAVVGPTMYGFPTIGLPQIIANNLL